MARYEPTCKHCASPLERAAEKNAGICVRCMKAGKPSATDNVKAAEQDAFATLVAKKVVAMLKGEDEPCQDSPETETNSSQSEEPTES